MPQLVNLVSKRSSNSRSDGWQLQLKTNTLRRGINRARFGGEAFVMTIASLFQDAEFGNVSDLFGLNPSTKRTTASRTREQAARRWHPHATGADRCWPADSMDPPLS